MWTHMGLYNFPENGKIRGLSVSTHYYVGNSHPVREYGSRTEQKNIKVLT